MVVVATLSASASDYKVVHVTTLPYAYDLLSTFT